MKRHITRLCPRAYKELRECVIQAIMALLSNLHLDSHLRYHGVLETGLIVVLIVRNLGGILIVLMSKTDTKHSSRSPSS